MNKVIAVMRTFQVGTGAEGKEFDWQYFSKIVACQINDLFKLKTIEGIVVVINGDQQNSLTEVIGNDGKTPSVRAMEKTFSEEIANGKIFVQLCRNWGYSSALNEGVKIARDKFNAELILTLSPEMEVSGLELDNAIEFMAKKKLSVLGFQREGWQVPRNTIALWEFDALEKIGGFSLKCDDIGKTVLIPKFGEVPLAGMEDFYAILRMLKILPNFRWGMIGNLLKWNVNFPKGSEREYRHLMKIARQETVMQEYAKWVFSDLSYKQVMKILFACCYRS